MGRTSHFGSVGAGIIHGPSFINVYNNPVLNPKQGGAQGRSQSRGAVRLGAGKRKIKKRHNQLMTSAEIVKVNDADRSVRENETVNSFNQQKLNNSMTPKHDAHSPYATM